MQLELRMRSDVPAEISAWALRRVQFAIGRLGSQVERVTVRLSDVNGPRGGRDKRCHILVSLQHGHTVSVEALDDSAYGAVSRAADSMARAVHRKLTRPARGPKRASARLLAPAISA